MSGPSGIRPLSHGGQDRPQREPALLGLTGSSARVPAPCPPLSPRRTSKRGGCERFTLATLGCSTARGRLRAWPRGRVVGFARGRGCARAPSRVAGFGWSGAVVRRAHVNGCYITYQTAPNRGCLLSDGPRGSPFGCAPGGFGSVRSFFMSDRQSNLV